MTDKAAQLRDQSIGKFLSQLQSTDPTPGGGAGAAVLGALGASLATKVANVTTANDQYEDVRSDFLQLSHQGTELTTDFLQTAEKDNEAFQQVMKAYNQTSDKQLSEALEDATKPPFEIAELAHVVLDISDKCASQGNKNAITDAAAAAIMGYAAIAASLVNVDINLAGIDDEEFIQTARQRRKKLEQKGQEKMEKVIHQMHQRLGGV